MNQTVILEDCLGGSNDRKADRLTLFALINLGVLKTLMCGYTSASEAVERFDSAENCLFVRRKLENKRADRIMGHGVQLPDLFDLLPVTIAQREFSQELAKMKALCLQLMEKSQSAV